MRLKKIYQKFSYKNYSGEAAGLIVLKQDQINVIQKIMLDMCDDIFDLCREKGYVCFLGGGSALGAIRHHGFIPWDDDVDLCITRESYTKFIPEFRKRYGEKYWIHTPEDNPGYGIGIARIRKKGTKIKERIDLYDDSEAGVAIDIFIIENVYDDKLLKNIQGLLCMAVKVCLSCRGFYRDQKIWKEAAGDDKNLMKAARFRLIIGFLCAFMSVEKWTILANSVYSMCKNNHTQLVTIPQGRGHFWGEMCKRSEFCTTETMKFEGRDYPVCKGIEAYMERLYGSDYMKIPPVEKREKHIIWALDLGEHYNKLSEN